MKVILDTSALIALRKDNARVKKALSDRREKADDVGLSRLSEYELRVGGEYLWKKHGDAREVVWLEDALSWLKVYEVDEEVVADAADVQARCMEDGNPVPDMDLLVALSAKRGSDLITLDEDHSEMRDALQSKGVTVSFLGELE